MAEMIFFDVDNTLWDHHMQIPESTAETIRKLKEAGHRAFICTGRARGNLRSEELLSLPFAGIVAACGNHIEINGQLVYEKLLPEETLRKCIEIMKKYHMPMVLEGPWDHWVDMVGLEGDPYVDYLYRVMGDSLHPLIKYEEGMKINKVSAVINEDTDYEAVRRELDGVLTMLRHPGKVVEMIPAGSSKADGIRRVCEYFCEPAEHTYAVGDSTNDLEMIGYARHGIAMGNATETVKKAAEYITDDICRDGIYKAMCYYGLIRSE